MYFARSDSVSSSSKTTVVKQIISCLQKLKGEFTDKPGLFRSPRNIDDIRHVELVNPEPDWGNQAETTCYLY